MCSDVWLNYWTDLTGKNIVVQKQVRRKLVTVWLSLREAKKQVMDNRTYIAESQVDLSAVVSSTLENLYQVSVSFRNIADQIKELPK